MCLRLPYLFSGFTAIHMAAMADNVEALALLVELTRQRAEAEENEDGDDTGGGGDDNITVTSASVVSRNDDDSLSMVHSQFDYTQNTEVKEFLNLASNNDTSPLHIACLNNSLRVAEFLLKMKVRVDFQDSAGDTALHKAGRKQLNTMYQMLLETGASQSIKNNYGETPKDLLNDDTSY